MSGGRSFSVMSWLNASPRDAIVAPASTYASSCMVIVTAVTSVGRHCATRHLAHCQDAQECNGRAGSANARATRT